MKMSCKTQGHCLWRSMSSNLFHFKTPKKVNMQRTFFPYFPIKDSNSNPITIMSNSSLMNTSSKTKHTEVIPSMQTIKSYLNPNEPFTLLNHKPKGESKAKVLKDYKYDFHSKIFHDKDKIFKKHSNIIDNKLNIRYAKNEAVYQKQLKILNKKRLIEGKKPIKDSTPNLLVVNKQLGDMKEIISFVKSVTNFAYIDIESEKIRLQTNRIQLFKSKSAPYYIAIDEEMKRKELNRAKFLNKPLVIESYNKKKHKKC